MNHRESFQDYMQATSPSSSGKASSYLRAIDMLGEILTQNHCDFSDIANIWDEQSPRRIDQLYKFVLLEQKSGDLFKTDHPKSYWTGGFYSAALKNYRIFLVEQNHIDRLRAIYESQDEHDPSAFDIELRDKDSLVEESEKVGSDLVRKVKVRAGQQEFRNQILKNYDSTCCITGLNLPELNEAGHIIGWSERKETRLDPRNGLCLSATYHRAFDRRMIGFDEKFRLVLSKDLRDQCTTKVFDTYFKAFEGRSLHMPKRYPPNSAFLAEHLKKLA